ncbi:hypothetical protein K7X08_007100 [Anisodus acutangulus]|uniref:Uncharacterized protein n=1 Tax=Anisodus acutangulus TaxID=402998 RepID=A0A9Q1QZ58_9SOLA|nr:hypothetical protein K7X08_007100 [Anisodus acutangulus]
MDKICQKKTLFAYNHSHHLYLIRLHFLLYTERISTIGSISPFKPCSKRISAGERALESDSIDNPADDTSDFDPDECSVNHGKWVFNSSIKPLYTEGLVRIFCNNILVLRMAEMIHIIFTGNGSLMIACCQC